MPVKELYLAKSMKDLESKTELKKNLTLYSTKLLVKSAEKVFKEGQEKFLDCDEETAYVHYMHFIELVLLLRKRQEFTKHKSHDQLLSYANTALSKAECLKARLSKRYSCLEKAASKENEMKDNFRSVTNNTPDVSADISVEKYEPTESLKLPVEKPIGEEKEKSSISSSKLHSLLQITNLLLLLLWILGQLKSLKNLILNIVAV